MKLLANIITAIFHPVPVAILGVYLIAYTGIKNPATALVWTGISALFAGLVVVFVLYGVKKGMFSNIDISKREQRVKAFPFVILVSVLFMLVVYVFSGPFYLILGSILFMVALVLLDLVNTKVKASIHVASVAALVTGLVFMLGVKGLPLYLLVPISGWARVLEKKHTVREVIAGSIAGTALAVMSILIVQYF